MRSPAVCPWSTRVPGRACARGRPPACAARVAAARPAPPRRVITPGASPRSSPRAHSPGTETALGSPRHGRAARVRPAALPDASVLTVLATCAAAGKLAEEHTRLGAAVSAPLVAMGTAMVLAAAGVANADHEEVLTAAPAAVLVDARAVDDDAVELAAALVYELVTAGADIEAAFDMVMVVPVVAFFAGTT